MTANVGPAKDDEEFGPFSVQEVQDCFKAFDLDHNNFVGALELRKYWHKYVDLLIHCTYIYSHTYIDLFELGFINIWEKM